MNVLEAVVMNVLEAVVVAQVMIVSSVVMLFMKDNVCRHVHQAYTR